MLEISNAKVYDLEESVIAARNAMRTEMPDYNQEEFEKSFIRCKKLTTASKNSKYVKCHDNYLTGIRVSFDLKYTQYITKQFQRYHFFDYVSSSSLMHKILKLNFDKCCNKYISQETVDKMDKLISEYNQMENDIKNSEIPPEYTFKLRGGEIIKSSGDDALYYKFMQIISECPMGTELFVRISTNYKQLQTIYYQRKNHKLKEDWGEFCKFVENLPYAKELILAEDIEDNKN